MRRALATSWAKQPAELGVCGEVLPYDLDGDGAAARRGGEVDDTHAAGAEAGVHPVAADLTGVVERQRRVGLLRPGGLGGGHGRLFRRCGTAPRETGRRHRRPMARVRAHGAPCARSCR